MFLLFVWHFDKSNEPCVGSNFVGEKNSYKPNYLFYMYASIEWVKEVN